VSLKSALRDFREADNALKQVIKNAITNRYCQYNIDFRRVRKSFLELLVASHVRLNLKFGSNWTDFREI